MRNGPYELVLAPDEYPGFRYRGRYVYEHHLVWWQRTGELVPDGFVVHHKNDNRRDNRFSNLKLMERVAHTVHHNKESHPPMVVCCGWCGKSFKVIGHVCRARLKSSKSGKLFCCRSHQVQYQHKHYPRRHSSKVEQSPRKRPG